MDNLNKYINHLRTTDNWKKKLIQFVSDANGDGKSVTVIAIARKMARLLEYHRQQDKRLDDLFSTEREIRNSVVTEHAIPLCLNGIDPASNELLILDDLIVYGDTVETVSEVVYYFTGIKPKIIAMAASETANYEFEFGEILYPRPIGPDNIKQNDIPAFTAENSWDIISLGKSIDLEHTIFSIQGDFSSLLSKRKGIVKQIKEVFGDSDNIEVYAVSHHIPGGDETFSVTILFRQGSPYTINQDFSKIRIFIGPDIISVTAYTPGFWDENLIENQAVYFQTRSLNGLWREVADRLSSLKPAEGLEIYGIKNMSMERDFSMRIEHTAVVMVNYLLSFDSIMVLLGHIDETFRRILGHKPEYEVSSRDLSLLIGEELAEKFQPILQQNMEGQPVSPNLRVVHSVEASAIDKPLIPMGYLKDYQNDILTDTYLSTSVQMALTLIFRRLRNDFGLINNRGREERVRVGETFDSLESTLSKVFPKKHLWVQIHKWIDINIDLGFVVPKYEYFIDRLGYRVWRRYFRSGERGSEMENISLAAVCVIKDNFEIDRVISFTEFKQKVYPVLETLSQETDGQLNLDTLTEDIYLKPEIDNGAFPLWIYLILTGMMKLVSTDSWGNARLCTESTTGLKTALF